MTEKKDRDRVMAEITLSHLLRLATEQGSPVSREQALAFLNQEGRAFEMWKHMMQAGEEFIERSLLRQCIGAERTQPIGFSVGNTRGRPITTVCGEKGSLF